MKKYKSYINFTPTLEEILADCCAVYQQSISDIKSKSRKEDYANVRCIFCFVAFIYTPFCIREISKIIGNRDHTTAMHQRNLALDLFHTNDCDFIERWKLYRQESKYFKDLRVIRTAKDLTVKQLNEYANKANHSTV